ncbi:type VI secretion system membrane subunit TssM [Caballeronia sp. LZ043]|uniref:type VI secretion system membrane subunit TssM n=1 Tax=Caballeronia sp. LZ043 TaxID=3038569 RepID=UPI002865C1AA|nr:type VI secretion system membrane subunit TssM [Caballeronia sp. LZ043]MDR5823379.1 type VI secretion system membrane subunit TssM [Caballeronia sp. LZ043]
MKKLLSFLFSRLFFAIIALLLLVLAVWFIGPYFAFGGLKPLESVALRVTVIALILCGALLRLRHASMALVFGALLCLLIWHAAPLLSFGERKPFASTDARIVAIAAVVAVFVGWLLYRIWCRMRSDEQFLRRALAFGNSNKPESLANPKLRQLETRFRSMLESLKSTRTGGFARLFQRTRHLYELPWFIALGSEGSGKTRALLNAGLPVPASVALRQARPDAPADPTVDWWLTDEALCIDTPGYYTRPGQSSHPLTSASETQAAAAGLRSANVAPLHPSIHTDLPNRRETDRQEWLGFLRMLRRHRPRAPINGALLTIRLDLLTAADVTLREAEADALRARLADLRRTLGVRFPVYLIVTQMDRLSGFADYFAALTEEHRAQVWGFTLPVASPATEARCREELALLAARLADGLNTRLEDEFDLDRRRRLVAFPEAFAALAGPLAECFARLFTGTRYDDTEHHPLLRGVYFTSAAQEGLPLPAEPATIARRLADGVDHALTGRQATANPASPAGNRSYFLHDVFRKVILPEAHLVRPNLRWEYRFRLLRLIGHALAVLLFAWLAVALHESFGNNSRYLEAVTHKTQALSAKVAQLYREPRPDGVPDALTDALHLPARTGLDLARPDASYRYGLYVAPGIVDASGATYRALEASLLLPQLVHRIEAVIAQAIARQDPKAAYSALRVYLMLYEPAKFNGSEIKTWVLDDWSRTDSASAYGGRASMLEHLDRLFAGQRVVQSPLIRNDALIERARSFLDQSNGTQRLYDRAKAAMQDDAPDDFTLLRAVGPQAGMSFTRASGEPLSRGVPGLFTFDGYRALFDRRLAEFLKIARDDDAWVMGRAYLSGWTGGVREAQKKTAEFVSAASGGDDALTDAIRRLYLTEYRQHWSAFLADIRPVTGSSAGFNLQIMRQFAAPDSPLARLAFAAARETTLTRSLTDEKRSLLDQADAALNSKTKGFGMRAQERVERELVDDRFAALREMVTGEAQVRPDAPARAAQGAPSASASAQARQTGLDGVATLLNDTYTALTIAETALSNNGLPPPNDASAKLKMAADTMPAPFRAVLQALALQGSRDVNQGVGQLLSHQTQAVVGDACRLAVEGNYPFVRDSARDISIDDFTRMFAQGGLFDDFFIKNLAPFVDTSSQPWRYRTLPGSTAPVQGPDLVPFQRAQAIRQVFFGEQGKQIAWKADVRVPELDPTILSLAIDIDGQGMLYQHGPVTPLRIAWPGPRGGVHVELTASPRIRTDTSTLSVDGPWALMRLLGRGQIVPTATPGRVRVVFDFDGRKAALDIASTGSLANPLTSDLLTAFHCPAAVPLFDLADSGPPPGLPAPSTMPASP